MYTSAVVVSLSKKFFHLAPVDPAISTGECEATLEVVCSLSKTSGSYHSSASLPSCNGYLAPAEEGRLDPHENLQSINLVDAAIQDKINNTFTLYTFDDNKI